MWRGGRGTSQRTRGWPTRPPATSASAPARPASAPVPTAWTWAPGCPAAPLDLSGRSISDDPTNVRKFVFAAGTVIQPGQYLTLYGDNRAVAGEVHVKFSLKAGGEGVFLYNTDRSLIDSVVFGPQATDL